MPVVLSVTPILSSAFSYQGDISSRLTGPVLDISAGHLTVVDGGLELIRLRRKPHSIVA